MAGAENVHSGIEQVCARNQHEETLKQLPYDRSALDVYYEDCRYFVIKSNNYENVMIAKHRGVWSTPPQNEKKLNSAFENHKNIILLFSIKESGRFSGIARLISRSVVYDSPVPWVLPPFIDPVNLRNTFRLMWLNKNDLYFNTCSHLTNPYNENKEIKIARDGQELEPSIGFTVCHLFPPDPLTESYCISLLTVNRKIAENRVSNKLVSAINNHSHSKKGRTKKRDTDYSHEGKIDKYPYPGDILDQADAGRYVVDSIISKNYDEYLASVISLRRQMNLKALGVNALDDFTQFDEIDPTELADEIVKYYYKP